MFTTEDELTGRFTFEAEGSTNPKNPYFIGKLSHPSPESGVTIGAGYDMGGRSEQTVKADLQAAGIEKELAEKLAKGALKTGILAAQFVSANAASLVVNDLQALRALFARTYPDYVKRARAFYNYHAGTFKAAMTTYGSIYGKAVFFPWENLYPAIRLMAVDFVYQGFGRPENGYGRPLHFCMANDFDWLANYITNTPGLSKYEKGRNRVGYLQSRKNLEVRMYSKCAIA